GGAAVGPHRSDLEVRHLGHGMPAGLCSTGEQKALLIAIVLANARLQTAERGRVPLLLLDEVAAHLDASRREALFEEIDGLGAQAWYTGTDRAVFESLDGRAQHVTVHAGQLRPEAHAEATVRRDGI
ncbi:MAG: DNA replication and repair protein RecF, partial [Pseudomonadota bacterium]